MQDYWLARVRQHATSRRSMLLGAAGAGVGLALSGTSAVSAATPTSASAEPPFDFDTGNAAESVLGPFAGPAVYATVAPSDATLIIRFANMLELCWFDAIAPYHPTAVGIYTQLPRRPRAEAATNRNKNIAILYASFRVFNSVMPQYADTWREMLQSVGLDPADDSTDPSTPVGIGNLTGRGLAAAREHDGMNQLGDHGGQVYHRQPYADYTGYRPRNTAYELTDASHWQPAIVTKGNGIFQVQQFVTPQLKHVTPYSYTDPKEFLVPPPTASNHRNKAAYKAQVDAMLATSAGLTDEQKTKAEFFDDKFASLGLAVGAALQSRNLGLDEWVHLHAVAETATFDAAIAAWYNKNIYDSVRPFTAIRHVYQGQKVTAWGGPGKGTVSDLPAEQWRAYLLVADHSEYPSGSTALCAAEVQAARRYLGTDQVRFRFERKAGSSLIEPGITPREDLVLSWDTWTDWMHDCGMSRYWGGVHFPAAIQASWEMGRKIGDLAYEFVRRQINGEAVLRTRR
ncbi:vanadium-dependent haloperoxidase [Micromonospora eburnea]|uniref:PAP2 superfamily n=1 Tax=Micromonospora eburnea TaxID=227316 RepID=A0A1C6UGK6_9ACTN|nr:vanadium-dependent haloperoxidase [Micromonospora eburnea]SCL53235.1 PAP2 superfamily [Micromonospora eburnea]